MMAVGRRAARPRRALIREPFLENTSAGVSTPPVTAETGGVIFAWLRAAKKTQRPWAQIQPVFLFDSVLKPPSDSVAAGKGIRGRLGPPRKSRHPVSFTQ